MRCLFARSVALAVVLASAATASAQSLADVARREEERRKAIGNSGKVYTNDDLQPVPASEVPAPPSTPAASSTAEPAADAPAASGGEDAKPEGEAAATAPKLTPEQMWRKRIADERAAMARAQVLADALQSRINGLTTDFENRGDPVQKNALFADRQTALAELDRMKKEISDHQKAIADIQEEARRAGVPAGWTR